MDRGVWRIKMVLQMTARAGGGEREIEEKVAKWEVRRCGQSSGWDWEIRTTEPAAMGASGAELGAGGW